MYAICMKCGKGFEALTSQRRMCYKCRGTWLYRKKKPHPLIKCATCGAILTSSRISQKYCSDKCRAAAHSKKVFVQEVCAFCGKEFETSTAKKKYCSRECYTEAKRIRDAFKRNGGKIEVS